VTALLQRASASTLAPEQCTTRGGECVVSGLCNVSRVHSWRELQHPAEQFTLPYNCYDRFDRCERGEAMARWDARSQPWGANRGCNLAAGPYVEAYAMNVFSAAAQPPHPISRRQITARARSTASLVVRPRKLQMLPFIAFTPTRGARRCQGCERSWQSPTLPARLLLPSPPRGGK
jgi:hypothetical protein